MDRAHLDVQYNVCGLHGRYRLINIQNDESHNIAVCERNVQVQAGAFLSIQGKAIRVHITWAEF